MFIAAAQALLLLEVHCDVLQADLFKANISHRTNSRHKPGSLQDFTHFHALRAKNIVPCSPHVRAQPNFSFIDLRIFVSPRVDRLKSGVACVGADALNVLQIECPR